MNLRKLCLAASEKSFENVNGTADRRTENGQNVITLAHPELSLIIFYCQIII